MSIAEVCNREVVVITRGESAQEAAKLMREFHVGDLVVVEERQGELHPVGVLTDRDIVIEVIAREVDIHTLTVSDIMSFELVSANEADELMATIKLMRSKGVRRLPVVTPRGVLVGIVTLDDLLELLAEQLNDIVALFRREQKREREMRTIP